LGEDDTFGILVNRRVLAKQPATSLSRFKGERKHTKKKNSEE
jgi:hypothetical protein